METVVILMSTYNGEKYISDQMDSIFSQRDVDVRLMVRDDGSTDSTLMILKSYLQKYPGKIELIIGENIGWRKSFFLLASLAAMRFTGCRYFAFCDQDDIWLPHKLSAAIDKLINLPYGPKLYCSNLFHYTGSENMGKIRTVRPKPTFKNCLVRNYATGCTVVFNYDLLAMIAHELPSIMVAHDYWFYQVAVLCGSVYVDDDSYILYRQHENNQIGNRSGWKDVWKRRIKEFKGSFSGHSRETQTKELLRIHSVNMKPAAKESVEKFAFYRKSLINRIRLFIDKEYSLDRKSNDFWLKIRILLGRL